jgi:hypothetical protein
MYDRFRKCETSTFLTPKFTPCFARDNLEVKKVSVTAKSPSKMVKKGPQYPLAHCLRDIMYSNPP